MDSTYQDCTLLHVDADGFFAGVEQALTPALRGKPVVTGSERGIIAAASHEAQAQGIKRGLELHEVRQNCPGLVVLPSDYETYSLYSRHLYGILRRFTPCVEEYSIDEAFADLTGCGGVLGHPLESVAKQLRMAVSEEMGLTVSVGISLTKTLAKLCSKFRKPNGQTILRREHVPLMLKRTPIAKVWKLGSASAAKLQSHGISTACDFTRMDESLVLRLLHKPGHETWRELRGERVFALDMERKQTYDTMMKSHTFSPPNGDRRFVFAEALNNMTTAMAKLRRHNHLAKEIGLCLRFKDYAGQSASASLTAPTAHDCEAAPHLRTLFDALFVPGQLYRSTLVWLGGLVSEHHRQLDLFEEGPQRQRYGKLDEAVDGINRHYGQRTVAPATLLDRRLKPYHSRDATPDRYDTLQTGESVRHLAIPRMTLGNPV